MAARRRARTLPSARQGSTKLIASNRRARHDYELLDVVEAGVVLSGSEVKSLRLGQVQLADGFARGDAGELWLEGVHISPYQFATDAGAHDPTAGASCSCTATRSIDCRPASPRSVWRSCP